MDARVQTAASIPAREEELATLLERAILVGDVVTAADYARKLCALPAAQTKEVVFALDPRTVAVRAAEEVRTISAEKVRS
mmetsp:Transcript_2059/g.4803  ORF Transcript_2059/g.4803 Transcript_2059/m.4803 type:complete len:80 (-) Transcript_2059:245-484(-)|eukprot:CAMPEP_0178997010 /NCGR_PEP_ID=MMETSP0795-20121207/8693_1 /TAXON_ID=88552 /ORGANISM="Amoebophrya sp., Strain Ameob2" /LENGTH=79 /DNA_ID=CAMNT_0020689477 /DNA_START=56 /DNA_END=295 /DNA_ORIENTATION=+